MFFDCENFDCDLCGWDVSNVKDMSYLFFNCINFTGEGLENWKPIKCKDMHNMFKNCYNFDCNLSGWDVSNVKNMRFMFFNCTKFTGQGLENWKPIKCKYIGYIFDECSSLNSYPIWYYKK
jgi:surface protein